MRKTVLACDVCEIEQGTVEVNIEVAGEVHRVDLCPEHQSPILKVLQHARVIQTPLVPRGSEEVLSWDQFQQLEEGE